MYETPRPDQTIGQEELMQLGRKIIVFIGPEGSGKSTIAQLLSTKSQKPYVTTGGIFRDMAENDQTEFGDECREMLRERRYLKPEMLFPILVKRFSQNDAKDGFVLDGGLRLLEEVENFPLILQKADREMPLTVVHLRIPGWLGMERLITSPNARRRDGDTPDGVLNRLANYYKNLGQRATLIQQQEDWSLVHIDAMDGIDETFGKVRKALCSQATH